MRSTQIFKSSALALMMTSAALGQYQWYSGSWATSQSSLTWGHLYTTQFFNGGEVRTTFDSGCSIFSCGATHYHQFSEYEDSFNPGTYLNRFLKVRVYNEYPNGFRVEVSTQFESNSTLVSSFLMSGFAGSGSVFSSVYWRNAGPNGQAQGLYIRLGTEVAYVNTSFDVNGSLGRGNANYGSTAAGALDGVAPNAVTGLSASLANGTLSVVWNASADNTNGIGGVMYEVYRNSTLLGAC